jgi:AcrR family transcriptional regulator
MTPQAVAAASKERRLRQKSERRDAILAAARKVFAQRGYDGTTVADIAREAGVAAGTVYLYYSSKTDLFAALNLRLYKVINEAIASAEAPLDLAGGTRTRIAGVFQAARRHSDLIRLVFLNPDPRTEVARRMKRADEERLKPLADLLRGGMDAGIVRRSDAYVLARIITGLVIMGLYQCFVQSDGSLIDVYQDTITDMVVGALRPS